MSEWFVIDHENDDRVLRGPYQEATTAGAVRTEMERRPPWDERGNLWIVSSEFFKEEAGQNS